MKTAELNAIIREKTGANDAEKLRKDNKIPAVVYGESGVKHIAVDYLQAAKVINTPDLYLINLHAEGENRRVIVQDTQYHPLTDKITHIDFLEAAVGKTAVLRIPVHFVGSSVGVLNGGQMVAKTRHVHIKGVPAELPEFIEVDISGLNIGKSIKVGDVKGYELTDNPNNVIVLVKAARNIEELTAPVAPEGVSTEAPAAGAAEGEAAKEGAEAKPE